MGLDAGSAPGQLYELGQGTAALRALVSLSPVHFPHREDQMPVDGDVPSITFVT